MSRCECSCRSEGCSTLWTLRDVVDFIRQVALRELGYERSRHDGARSRREHAISRLVRNPAGMQVPGCRPRVISSEQGAAVVRSARHADSSHLVCLADATSITASLPLPQLVSAVATSAWFGACWRHATSWRWVSGHTVQW